MATAFLRDKCEKVIQMDYLNYRTKHFWNSSGKRCESFNDFQRNAVLGHVEYGLTSWCTLAADGSYETIHESLNGKTQGFGDVEASLKNYLWCKNGHLFSTEARVIIPVAERKTELRYGRWGGQASLLYSKKFQICGLPGWYDTKVGYRFYEGFPSDQVRAKAAVGLCLSDRFTVLTSGELQYGLFNGSTDPQNTILWNSNYRLFTGKVEGFFRVCGRAYLTVGGFRHLWGRNVGTGGGVFGGARIVF